jgi:hypothetical protein
LTHAGKGRKRYLLLLCEKAPTVEVRRAVVEFVRERHPDIGEKSVISVSGGIIIRSRPGQVNQLSDELENFEAEGVTLRSASTSGSISKLKRLAGR